MVIEKTNGTIAIDSNGLKAVFDLQSKGSITSLSTQQGQVEVVSSKWSLPTLFRIGLVESGQAQYYSNLDFEQFGHQVIDGGLQFTYSGLEDKGLDVIAIIREESSCLSFGISVKCGADVVCSDLMYPYVNGFKSLSGRPAEDRYLFPFLTGEIHHNPVLRLKEPGTSMIGTQGYPGSQGVQFHALYNEKGGIVMYTPDSDCHPKRFGLQCDQNPEAAGWFCQHYFDETPGFTFVPDYVVRIQECGPSWYDAADIYAAWSRNQWWMERRTPRRSWIDAMPIIASTHDNKNYTRVPPAWIAEKQPEMNRFLGGRNLINDFQHWEHYGFWAAPDSFPPFGGEDAMVEAAKTIRSHGNHLKHLFSCGQYWLHEDITDEVFENTIKPMAIMPRDRQDRESLVEYFPTISDYVVMCPSSEEYQEKLVHYVEKLTDYHHDFISMDIWPLRQPQQCHNSNHRHPPGLGKWYVEANIRLIKKLQEKVFAKRPEAIFGGESMAEPYLPWMHVTLMRNTTQPVDRSADGKIQLERVPLFDYIYGDQVIPWSCWATSQTEICKAELSLQFVRRQLLHVSDKWHHKFVNFGAMGIEKNRKAGDPVPDIVLDVKLGGPELRQENLSFAEKVNELQCGRFNDYFSRGRSWRIPDGFVYADSQWKTLEVYEERPTVGAVRHPDNENILWVFGNGWNEKQILRLRPLVKNDIANSSLKNPPGQVDHDNQSCLEIVLEPFEIGYVEWRLQKPG